MCLIRSGYNEKGQFELIFIDRYTDWAKCPLYMSPTSEEIFESDEFEETVEGEDDEEDEEDDDE